MAQYSIDPTLVLVSRVTEKITNAPTKPKDPKLFIYSFIYLFIYSLIFFFTRIII